MVGKMAVKGEEGVLAPVTTERSPSPKSPQHSGQGMAESTGWRFYKQVTKGLNLKHGCKSFM